MIFALGGLACQPSTGVVELAWEIVDRDGGKIFPAGAFSLGFRDTCALPGRLGTTEVRYALHVVLDICDPTCAGGCEDPDCAVVEPRVFRCDVARGSDPDIPAAQTPYRFSVGALVVPESQAAEPCHVTDPSCVAVPGLRDRTIVPGLVTDLQVYRIGLDINQSATAHEEQTLDLEACGCG